MSNILAILPARAGSKGLPGKNIRLFAGTPLLAVSIQQAKESLHINRVIVSTDSQKIADIAEAKGAEVPFLRPKELSGDAVTDFPVLRHALDFLQKTEGYTPDIVVWLRPTAPLRTTEDIDGAIDLLQSSNADTVRSICPAHHHPYWMKTVQENGKLAPLLEGKDEKVFPRRQLLPDVYRLNGAVDVFAHHSLLSRPDDDLYGGEVRGYIMENDHSVDIDTNIGFALAELLYQART